MITTELRIVDFVLTRKECVDARGKLPLTLPPPGPAPTSPTPSPPYSEGEDKGAPQLPICRRKLAIQSASDWHVAAMTAKAADAKADHVAAIAKAAEADADLLIKKSEEAEAAQGAVMTRQLMEEARAKMNEASRQLDEVRKRAMPIKRASQQG